MTKAVLFAMVVLLGCQQPDSGVVRLPPDQPGAGERRDQSPVALNADSPIEYPPALFREGIEGSVLLRLYVDSTGTLIPDSTTIYESSGYPALDSAAVAGSVSLEFSPALREGEPVAAAFIQPIEFRPPGDIGP